MTSLGLELTVKENSQLSYQSVTQLLPQLLVFLREAKSSQILPSHTTMQYPPTPAVMTALDSRGSGKVQDGREGGSFECISPESSPVCHVTWQP